MISLDTSRRPLIRALGCTIPFVLLFAAPVFGQTADKSADVGPAKFDLKVPGGLAFSEFRGYENWAVISIDHTDDLLKVILGNPVVMAAFRSGIPGNGKPFPDGSRMAKVEWHPKKGADIPYDIRVPGAIYDLDFMVKDAKRFPDSGGWGYAVFVYDAAAGKYVPGSTTHKPPQGNDARCGAACHTIVKGKDFVFTDYAKR